MATKSESAKNAGGSKTTFICKYCEKKKSFDEMVVVTDYFPPIVVCKNCARDIR